MATILEFQRSHALADSAQQITSERTSWKDAIHQADTMPVSSNPPVTDDERVLLDAIEACVAQTACGKV